MPRLWGSSMIAKLRSTHPGQGHAMDGRFVQADRLRFLREHLALDEAE